MDDSEALNSPINYDNSDLGGSSDMTMHDADHLPSIEVNEPCDGVPVKVLEEGKVPAYRAVFLIANAALGAGLLNFPQAFMKAGGVRTALGIELVRTNCDF